MRTVASRGVVAAAILAANLTIISVASFQAQAQTFAVLYAFKASPDGANPFNGVAKDSAGNLYGTTESGGKFNNWGTIFTVDTSNNETILYNFTGGNDGGHPGAGLVRDSAGNLYGTTLVGGASGKGVVFKLDTAGKLTVLHTFTGTGGEGSFPSGGLIRDSAGNLYGTTSSGGRAGLGIVFRLNTANKEIVLRSFMGGSDGGRPGGGLIRDASGNLYGTTAIGGNTACNKPYGCGTVFKLDSTARETILHRFSESSGDGQFPEGGLVRDSTGNLYGTTSVGGASFVGTVFRLNASGKETILYAFKASGGDGQTPVASLVRDSAGNLYGAAEYGGTTGYGAVFKVDSSGKETVLHSFNYPTDGGYPMGSLIRNSAGSLYGMTSNGGAHNAGTVFKVVP